MDEEEILGSDDSFAFALPDDPEMEDGDDEVDDEDSGESEEYI